MKNQTALACLIACLIEPLAAQAATIELRTFNALGPAINPIQSEIFQSDETQESVSTSVTVDPNGESVKATAGFAEEGRRLSADSSLFRPAQSNFVNFRAASFATYTDTLSVQSSGTVIVALDYTGAFSVKTDLIDNDTFAFLSASLEIEGLGLPIRQQAFQFSNPETQESSFSDRILATFDVESGDVFELTALVSATNGSTDDIPAFIEARSSIEGLFSITTRDGASFYDPDDVAPVPLPASLPLLFGGLLGLRLLQRRRSKCVA